ncbi:MAG: endonuclease/exonuclease/phosphatase family protein [Thermoleophilaceae bacterium]
MGAHSTVEHGRAAVLDEPPADVAGELDGLSAALDEAVPPKHLDRNLLIGTWNIRAFGDLTEKWHTGGDDSPKRNLADVRAIAEIASRFDVVAIQEARAGLKALRHMLKLLGPHWGLILTDVNRGDAGNGERLAFVFDLRRVRPSGLAAELVVPNEQVEGRGIDAGALQRQFVRTPYAVSFLSAGQTFILATLHVKYGDSPSERTEELRAIAEWLSDWASSVEDYNQNLIALGDFNIDREGDPNHEAFTSTGLRSPTPLDDVRRTVSSTPEKNHFYDQIAWFTDDGRAKLTLEHTGRAGGFDFVPHVHPDLTPQQKSWHISDHYPLWAEFAVPA